MYGSVRGVPGNWYPYRDRRQLSETINSLSVSGHPFHPLGFILAVVSRVLETLGFESESQPIS
jgi:hypothetical protein